MTEEEVGDLRRAILILKGFEKMPGLTATVRGHRAADILAKHVGIPLGKGKPLQIEWIKTENDNFR